VSFQVAQHVSDQVLTPAEVVVLRLIAAGNANKEIADQLAVTEDIVKGRVKRMMAGCVRSLASSFARMRGAHRAGRRRIISRACCDVFIPTFAGGWPGIGLLAMRLVVGSVLLVRGSSLLWSDPPWQATTTFASLAGPGLLLRHRAVDAPGRNRRRGDRDLPDPHLR
jgi:hypothetical protein